MLYCQRCRALIENDGIRVCGCGYKKLRAPSENDPVYLAVFVFPFSRMLEDLLAQHGIPYIPEKEGLDLLYQNPMFGIGIGKNQNIRYYIPYGALEKGKEIVEAYFSSDASEENITEQTEPEEDKE